MSLAQKEHTGTSTSVDQRRTAWPTRLVDAWPIGVTELMRQVFDGETINIEEFMDGGDLVVRAELPGIDPERDVDISADNGVLRIRAERRHEHTEDEGDTCRSEFSYGAFYRAIPLPLDAREEQITASYNDGILEVRVPTGEQRERSSKVPIQRGRGDR
jgi:HSP20 family protein